jgi:hypothetical protein
LLSPGASNDLLVAKATPPLTKELSKALGLSSIVPISGNNQPYEPESLE